MERFPTRLAVAAAGLMVVALSAPQAQQLQAPPPGLTLTPPTGLPIMPAMEGWYENDDGSVTISFGYYNRNSEGTLVIPFGERNRLEPAEFDGAQPTFFETGRHTGVFTVTLPADRRDESVWWYIQTGNSPMNRVPGRTASEAYQLDRRPRPQGSVPPLAWFADGGPRSQGPDGITIERAGPVRVGEQVELTVHAMDPSERDPDDPRFQEPVAVVVHWAVHQGPAAAAFTRHESTTPASEEQSPRDVTLATGEGTARVYATFSEPGDYMVRAQVDNFAAPESAENDQCCWTNVYERITVRP